MLGAVTRVSAVCTFASCFATKATAVALSQRSLRPKHLRSRRQAVAVRNSHSAPASEQAKSYYSLPRRSPMSSSSSSSAGAPSAPDLQPRKMSDSNVCELLPLNSDADTRALYADHSGQVLFGRLLEDLDSAAGAAAYLHCGYSTNVLGWSLSTVRRERMFMQLGVRRDNQTPTSSQQGIAKESETVQKKEDRMPPVIVTASLDRLDLLERPTFQKDAVLKGNVTCVGNSSMEVTLRLLEAENLQKAYLVARFTMVARDPVTKKAVSVNPLVATNQQEQDLIERGNLAKARRRAAAAIDLNKVAPTAEESLVIHDLWLKSLVQRDLKAASFFWMSDTRAEGMHHMRPQDRNMHNFVFGGHLMHLAADISEAAATLFAQDMVMFLAMDDVNFRKPVPIGSIVSLKACVLYACNKSMLVRATADVVDTASGDRDTTNVFHFVLATCKSKQPLRKLLPRTYEESMMYLDGKRRYDAARTEAVVSKSALLDLWV